MRDLSHPQGTSNPGPALLGFTLGAVIGAGLALLLAPESGKATRRRIADTTARWTKRAGHTIEEARDAVAELGTDAKAAIKAGQKSFMHERASRESHSELQVTHDGGSTPSPNSKKRPSEEVAG